MTTAVLGILWAHHERENTVTNMTPASPRRPRLQWSACHRRPQLPLVMYLPRLYRKEGVGNNLMWKKTTSHREGDAPISPAISGKVRFAFFNFYLPLATQAAADMRGNLPISVLCCAGGVCHASLSHTHTSKQLNTHTRARIHSTGGNVFIRELLCGTSK